MLICPSVSKVDVAGSDDLVFGAAIASTIFAFAGWLMWGIYSGAIAISTISISNPPSDSYFGLGIGLTFTVAAIVFWAMLVTGNTG